MTITDSLVEPQAGQIVGFIPEELREAYSQPLPLSHWLDQRQYSRSFRRSDLGASDFHSDTEHLFPVIQSAINLGGLALTDLDEYLSVTFRQNNAENMTGELGWHFDNGSAVHEAYRKVIVTDFSGATYIDAKTGKHEDAPDYSMLLIDRNTWHTPRAVPKDIVRTRIQIARAFRPRKN